jgi:ribonucleoside-diphosphate reductase alpha chain
MATVYSYDQALQDSLRYFGNESLPAKVFIDKYALRDKNPDLLLESSPTHMHKRIAKEIARIEKRKFKKPFTEKEIFSYIDKFKKIIPQGSPMFGIGNTSQFATLSNCYVLDSPVDSYGGIHHTDQQLTQIAKRRGGTGLDISNLRPAESPTTNSARTSSGIISFMERYSNSIREVGQNGRRGALMITCNVHHPQIMDFICCKEDKTKITGANISVKLTDEFLTALDNDEEYEVRWPVDSVTPKISRRVRAKIVWDAIIDHAWQSAEPGLLFWDNIIRESPADCYARFGFRTIATNPCSELPLSALDSCRLLLLNLFYYVKKAFTSEAYFDFEEFYYDAQVAQRFMDDIIDLEIEAIERVIAKIIADPEADEIKSAELSLWKRIKNSCVNGRRTGTGITALGDSLAALGVKYGSEESVALTDKIYRTLKLGCYRSSVDMAKELGPFPIFDAALESDCSFLRRIAKEDPELYADMQKHGRRNIALLTTAPAGSVSIEAMISETELLFGTTSGIEPCFNIIPYIRKKKVNPNDQGVHVDSVDQNGDHWQHYKVYHPALKLWMQVTGQSDITKSPWYGCCAEDVDWQQRVKLQATAQRHVDHAISSTINLPADASREIVSTIYLKAWRDECKGMTVYRKDCRSGVLVDDTNKEGVYKIRKTDGTKRPRVLKCNVHHLTAKKKNYVVLVGYLNGNKDEPYEVFVLNDGVNIPTSRESGYIKKVKRGVYEFLDDNQELLCENIRNFSGTDEEGALARMVSTSLRHGVDVKYLVHQLEKVEGSMVSFAKAMSRTLKKYILDGEAITGEHCPTCNSSDIVRQEGCFLCRECGFSKCS